MSQQYSRCNIVQTTIICDCHSQRGLPREEISGKVAATMERVSGSFPMARATSRSRFTTMTGRKQIFTVGHQNTQETKGNLLRGLGEETQKVLRAHGEQGTVLLRERSSQTPLVSTSTEDNGVEPLEDAERTRDAIMRNRRSCR